MRITLKKIFFVGAVIIFFYLEFISYWILPWLWWKLPDCTLPDCKKLLLVADPQIIGPEWKYLILMNWISIFDCDRYIKRTFVKAFNYIKPDFVIYLGDLMDQGYIASEYEYLTYFNRFHNIFDLSYSLNNTKIILAPGDNDIGGVDDILIPSSVVRFEKMFNTSSESTLHDLIEFCFVNVMTSKLQKSKYIDKNIRIAISHIPLVPKKYYLLNDVVEQIQPHIILSGHLHKSFHYITEGKNLWNIRYSRILPQNSEFKLLKFRKGVIHEIVVPTCSYRMGVFNMGYGVAYIDTKNMTMQYNVLWLPHRFYQLYVYLCIIVNFVLIELVGLFRKLRRSKQQYRSMESKKFLTFGP